MAQNRTIKDMQISIDMIPPELQLIIFKALTDRQKNKDLMHLRAVNKKLYIQTSDYLNTEAKDRLQILFQVLSDNSRSKENHIQDRNQTLQAIIQIFRIGTRLYNEETIFQFLDQLKSISSYLTQDVGVRWTKPSKENLALLEKKIYPPLYFNLSNTDLSNMSLKNMNLSQSLLFNANLQGADLEGVNLKSANLSGAHIENTNLTAAIFDQTNMYKTIFISPDLRGITFKNCSFTEAKIKNAIIDKAVFAHVGILLTEFDSLKGAEFLSLKQLESLRSLTNSELTGRNLKKGNFCNKNFSYSKFILGV